MRRARILEKDVFSCFKAGLTDDAGKAVNAEVSAVAWDGKRLVLASDKPIPGEGRSSVFALECHGGRPQPRTLVYYTAPLIRATRKYEDFALTVDGAYVIGTTGFDRVDPHSTDKNHYNQLLMWPCDDPDAAHVVAASEDGGMRSSVELRRHLEEVVEAPYFKIEGLAAIPAAEGGDDLLLFGVREVGRDHADFDYTCQIIGVPHRIEDGDLVFTGDFRIVYDFDPTQWDGVRHVVGLSSLEYDPFNHRLLLLTSFESTDDEGQPMTGGYLWDIALDDFHARRDPELVHGRDGEVLEFANKAEGVAVIDERLVLVAYDPDRNLALAAGHARAQREPHEAPYTLLALE